MYRLTDIIILVVVLKQRKTGGLEIHKLRRQDFARKMFSVCPSEWGPDFLSHTWFSDESYIEVWPTSYGRRGFRSHTGEKLELNVPKHGQKLMVFAAINAKGVFWKTFPAGLSITAVVYREVLVEFMEWLETKGFLYDAIYQQDGAPPHTEKTNLQLIRDVFGGKVISLKEMIEWPASSPDLNLGIGTWI